MLGFKSRKFLDSDFFLQRLAVCGSLKLKSLGDLGTLVPAPLRGVFAISPGAPELHPRRPSSSSIGTTRCSPQVSSKRLLRGAGSRDTC